MAITLDGSGTITGISAGGLPDGSVTADDLHTTLDLSGKTLTLPAGVGGKILQITQSTFTGVTTTTATITYTATGHVGTITTTADNSKILVFIDANGYQSAGGGGNVGLQRKIGTGSYSRLLGVDGTYTNSWMGWGNGTPQTSWQVNKMYLDDPQQVSGTTYTYEAMIGNYTAGTQYYGYLNYNSRCEMFMIEVAA
jgi:hypothetical protein